MLKLIFNFFFAHARRALSAFFRKPERHSISTMDTTNPLNLLLSSTLSLETGAFLYVYWSGVTDTPATLASLSGAERALSRFPVKTLRVNKKKTVSPEHDSEFLLIEVNDLQELQDRKFILECTGDTVNLDAQNLDKLKDSTVDDFFKHPDCKKLLDAISRAFQAIPSTALVASAAVVAGPVISDSIVDHTSLPVSIVQFLEFMSNFAVSQRASDSLNEPTPPKDARANDRWLGGARAKKQEYRTAREVRTFRPKNLTLFHLALLAHVVHSEFPLYSLFRNQCYWFSNIIYDAAKILDEKISPGLESLDLPQAAVSTETSTLMDEFFMPFYLYMPNAAGRWLGFKISEVEEVVRSRVVRKFHEQLQKHMAKVFLHSFCQCITTVY